MHHWSLETSGDSPVVIRQQGAVPQEKDLADESPETAVTTHTRAYRPSSGHGADGGSPVEDFGLCLTVVAELMVTTATIHGAAYR